MLLSFPAVESIFQPDFYSELIAFCEDLNYFILAESNYLLLSGMAG